MPGALITTGTALRGIDSAVAAGAGQFTNLNFGVASIVGGFKSAAAEVLKTIAVLGALPTALYAIAKSAASSASEIRRKKSEVVARPALDGRDQITEGIVTERP